MKRKVAVVRTLKQARAYVLEVGQSVVGRAGSPSAEGA